MAKQFHREGGITPNLHCEMFQLLSWLSFQDNHHIPVDFQAHEMQLSWEGCKVGVLSEDLLDQLTSDLHG